MMKPVDRPDVATAMVQATRRLLPKIAFAIGLVYAGYATLYATRLPAPGQTLLVILTSVSAIVLLGFSRLVRNRSMSVRQTHLAIGAMVILIVGNVAAEYCVSKTYLHGLGFVIAQMAAGALLPTAGWLVAVLAINVVTWLLATVAFGIGIDGYEATLALFTASLVSGVVFFVRVRTTALIESLRISVEQSRDRELREILDQYADAVVLHRRGEIVYANPSMAAVTAKTPDQLVGRHLSTLVAPASADRLAALLADEAGTSTHTLDLIRDDGQPIVVEITQPRMILFERESAMMMVGRDVTASREALHRQLVNADRMAVAGTLAAGLAHELNNPLAYVKLNLPLIGRSLAAADTAAREGFEDVVDGIDRIASIVEGLDAISPRHEGAVDQVDLTAAVEHAIALARNEIRHRAEIIADLTQVPPIMIDKGKLMQALLNLLINAVRSIDGEPDEHSITVRTCVADGRSTVEIADSGAGMSPEAVGRVFDPFFTTRTDGFGAGLGLYYCRSVVTAAGGTIDVTSELGRGTTFRVAFPIAPDVVLARPLAPSGHRPDPAQPLQVLVIDDEPAVGRAIQRMLTGCDVTLTTSGAEGIRRYEELLPDLVLCDIMMPGVSGPAVYENLHARYPEIGERVVFMTGGAFTKKARDFVSTTTVKVLKKPVEISTLRDLIAEHERRRVCNTTSG